MFEWSSFQMHSSCCLPPLLATRSLTLCRSWRSREGIRFKGQTDEKLNLMVEYIPLGDSASTDYIKSPQKLWT